MKAASPATEKLFNDISQFITHSKALLDQGAMAELAGLDEQVRTLCDAVLQLSQDERIRYADKLQELLGGLKVLGDEMVAKRDQVADQIRGVPNFKKASVAYKTANASDGYDGSSDD